MTRHEPRVGDLFTVRGRRLVGRVVSTEAIVGPTHGCVLVHLYADGRLSPDALLVPPLLTTRAPWSHGLFEHLRSEPWRTHPGRHCFQDASGRFVDELGRPLAAPFAPVGEYRLHGVDAIEELLAQAPGGYDAPPPGEQEDDDPLKWS